MNSHQAKGWIPSQRILFFLVGWVLLNLLQALFTELFHDEALYWVFSERPALGYFDHPPMVAWLIALTSWIPGEIGVRLPFIFLSGATLYLLWAIIRPKDEWLFISLFAGLTIAHVGGFFAAPDVPLVFFLTLFLLLYQSYFYKDNYLIAIAMGLVLGLMAWSKYHAFLFAIALVLSNIQLFKRRSFYVLILASVICILPHIYWQYCNDWITFDFHLNNRRGQQPWRWNYVFDYIGGQLLIFGPILAFWLFPAAIRFKQRDHYDCVMKYLFFVVMCFFLINSFRGKVEANWTAMVMPAALYLGYFYLEKKLTWRKYAMWAALIGFLLLLFLRLILAFEILPADLKIRNETHGFNHWSNVIAEKADGRPVIFTNQYRQPAKYSFYQNQPTYCFNLAEYSGNQYDLWTEDELAIQGENVMIVSNDVYSETQLEYGYGMTAENYKFIDDFSSYNYIDIVVDMPKEVSPGQLLDEITLKVANTVNQKVQFKKNVSLVVVFYQFEEEKKDVILFGQLPFSELMPNETKEIKTTFTCPDIKGEYITKFSLFHNELLGLNSKAYPIQVR